MDVETKFVLDELEVSKLVDEQGLVRGVEEGQRLHPFEAVGNAVVVHKKTGEEEAIL